MKAFPRQPIFYEETTTFDKQDGMDLRDYFAAKAMQAMLSIPETHKGISKEIFSKENVCNATYEWANEMMKARESK